MAKMAIVRSGLNGRVLCRMGGAKKELMCDRLGSYTSLNRYPMPHSVWM